MEKNGKLIVGAGESSADIRYATGLSTPDDFIWFFDGDVSVAVLSALEFDRARKQVKPGMALVPRGSMKLTEPCTSSLPIYRLDWFRAETEAKRAVRLRRALSVFMSFRRKRRKERFLAI